MEGHVIRQVKFVSIPVNDQDKALDFYTKKLGFSIVSDQPFDGKQRWIELGIPGAETRVVLFTADEHRNRIGTLSNLVFASENVQKTYEEYSKRGVEFDGPPKNEPWGTFAMFRDLDGNKFVLSSKA